MRSNIYNLKNKQWIILFGGLGREQVILSLIKNKINVKLIIIPRRQSKKFEKLLLQFSNLGISTTLSDASELESILSSHKTSILLSLGFPFKIGKEIYEKHEISLNIHPTLLPKYRGPTSGAHVIINGEKITGSTVHYLEEEIDKGPVIAQSKVSISPFDTIMSVQRKVYATEPSLILDAIKSISAGKEAKKQDESLASTYLNRRTPLDSEINPSKPLINLINNIRACNPDKFPAFFYHKGEKVCIKLWREKKPKNEEDMI